MPRASHLPNGINYDRERKQYRVRVTDPATGSRYSLGRFDTLTDAKAAHTLARAEMIKGTFISPRERRERVRAERRRAEGGRTPFEHVAALWLEGLRGGTHKVSTLREYESVLKNHLLPRVGALGVATVGGDVLAATVGQIGSESARRKAVIVLRGVLGCAVEHGLIESVPTLPRVEKWGARGEVAGKVITPEQVAALAVAMPERLRLSVLLGAWCALRQGEVLGLQRGDIDIAAATVRVARQWSQKAGEYTSTKTGRARSVVMPGALVAEVKEHLALFVGEGASAPLFPSCVRQGLPISQTQHNNAWVAAKRVVGVDVRFHDLRHTGLTFYAATGATVAEIMERGGHSNVDVAMRYQHAAAQREKALVEGLPVMDPLLM